jgi:hypothetical protein
MLTVLALWTALAGQSSQTVCAPNAAGQVVCRSRAENSESERCAGRDWLFVDGCSAGAHTEALRLRAARQAGENLRRQVSELLALDDCAGAVRTALSGGDINLAREAREFCASAPPSPAPAPVTE